MTWHLFSQILHAAWNMHPVRRIEAELFENNIDPLANESCRHQIELLIRYHARNERTYYRALREYRDYLTNIALRDTIPPVVRKELAVPVSTERLHRTCCVRDEAWKDHGPKIWEDPDNPEPEPEPPRWTAPDPPTAYL